jgi:hypothetical protein
MKKINIVVDNKYEFNMGENEPIYRTADNCENGDIPQYVFAIKEQLGQQSFTKEELEIIKYHLEYNMETCSQSGK